MKHRRCLVAGTLVAVTLAGGAAATNPVGPKDVFKVYTDALAAGDIDTAKRYVLADTKRMQLIDDRRPAAVAEQQFKAAVEKTFPGSLQPIGYGPATTRPAEIPDPQRVTIKGDSATLTVKETTESVRFRRVNGEWKVDLNAMYSAAVVDETATFRGALVEVMNALTAEIANGRFKTFDEVQAELETRVKMRLATPDLPVTTRPSF